MGSVIIFVLLGYD